MKQHVMNDEIAATDGSASHAHDEPEPWRAGLWGLFILAVGCGLFMFVSVDESRAMSVLSSEFALIYELGGRWALADAFLLLAGVFFALELHERRQQRRQGLSAASSADMIADSENCLRIDVDLTS